MFRCKRILLPVGTLMAYKNICFCVGGGGGGVMTPKHSASIFQTYI